MTYDPQKHHRRSIRLKGYDYSQAGAYFITIVTQDRTCLFGAVVDGEMRLNEFGEIVAWTWRDLPNHVLNMELDAFVVMPNHVHGIIVITDASANPVGAGAEPAPTERAPTKRYALPEIMRQFKTFSARRINEQHGTPGLPVWQRNYYEHIIRNDYELNRIREYIVNNPLQWALDRENPEIVIPIGQTQGQPRGIAPTKDEPWRT